ncbi:MAG: hypothetical protein EA426_00430 [Spirochaetaceae bacterium]|nr:MAG: hypothetical protein EA426_00430 [Spirochaetaceae bacterium]
MLVILILVVFAVSPAFGTDFDSMFDDDMFGDDMIEDLVEDDRDRSRDFLVSDEVEIGGRVRSSLSAAWGWTAFPDSWGAFTGDAHHFVGLGLGADVFLDARPSESLRVFAKVRTEYPFARSDRGSVEVFELFSDVNWNERVFFRVGKQTISWGAGYFWSPADILSLVPIDVDNPEADREGPLAVKTAVPFGRHHIDTYLIADESVREIQDLGIAARAVFYRAPVEFGVGLAYQRDNPFRVVASATLPVREVTAFADGRVSFGRDERVLRAVPNAAPGGPPYILDDDDSVYFSGTLGGQWMPDRWDFVVIAQYLFRGEGYTDPGLLPLAALAAAAGEISPNTILQFGQHHTMLMLSMPEFGHDSLTAGVQWHAAWSEPSGLVSTTLSWRWFEGFSLTGGIHLGYGSAPSEFGGYFAQGEPTFRNPYGRLGAGIELRIGGGRF